MKEKIIKSYKLGVLDIKARIAEGFVIMVTNQPQVTKQIYELAKKSGKKVLWSERLQAVTQFYEGKTAEQIEVEVDAEVKQAKAQGLDAFKQYFKK